MKKISQFLLSLLIGTAFLHPAQANAETAYERVLRTGTIRCAYAAWDPVFRKDPNTGAFSGYAYDYMEAIGQELQLKVEWSEEVGWGNFIEGLNTGRYDMMCVGVWLTAPRMKAALFSNTQFYQATLAYARADDDRFANEFEAANKPDIRVVTIDGDVSAALRKQIFPDSTEVSLPASSDSAAYFLSVATHKADVLIADSATVTLYNQTTEAKLHPIANGQPIRLSATAFAMKQNELQLKFLIDRAIEVVNSSGKGARILAPFAPGIVPVTVR